MPSFSIRPFEPADASQWLRCRLLSFFDTAYYDDVHTAPTEFDGTAIRLVATHEHRLIGLMDVEIVSDDLATIDVVAVHPAHQGLGVATELLSAALSQIPVGIRQLDAWTREDAAANAWYSKNAFTVDYRYLHVYAGEEDSLDGFTTPDGLSLPVSAFMHAHLDREDELRARFARVHECRRYVRSLA